MSTLHDKAPHVIQLNRLERELGLREDGKVAPITYHIPPDTNMAYATQEQPIAKTITYDEYVNAPGDTPYAVEIHDFFTLTTPELLSEAFSKMKVLTSNKNGELINPFDPDLTDAEKEVIVERCKNDLLYFIDVVLEGRAKKEPVVVQLFNALLNSKPPADNAEGSGRGTVNPVIYTDGDDFEGEIKGWDKINPPGEDKAPKAKRQVETLGGISVRNKNTQ